MADVYGQSDAVAVELTAALVAHGFSLPIAAQHLYARKLNQTDIGAISDPVTVQIFPGDELADLVGIDQIYDDTYGCHVLLLQRVADVTNGGLSESQVALLLKLRAEIIEYLCSQVLSCPSAVHPFQNAVVKAVRHGREGVYDLGRLEAQNEFYSELIFTYKAPGLRRRS